MGTDLQVVAAAEIAALELALKRQHAVAHRRLHLQRRDPRRIRQIARDSPQIDQSVHEQHGIRRSLAVPEKGHVAISLLAEGHRQHG